MEKYRTLHENKVLISLLQEDRLKLTSEKYHIPELIEKMKHTILKLPTIEYESDGTGYGFIHKGIDESGIYIKLEDVLNLFSAK